jgi:hypothetical protein
MEKGLAWRLCRLPLLAAKWLEFACTKCDGMGSLRVYFGQSRGSKVRRDVLPQRAWSLLPYDFSRKSK